MNSKGIKRKLNLNSHISMSSNKAKLDDTWSEFWDNNSPIHNEALSPLFYTLENHTDNIAYDKQGNEYSINGNTVEKNHKTILSITGEKFQRKEFDTNNLMEYYDGHFYEALPIDNRGYIVILKDGEFYKEVDIGNNFTILTMRLYKGDLFCLSRSGNTWYFDGWGKYIDISNLSFVDWETLSIKDVTFSDPKIQVNNRICCLTNKTGSIVRMNELKRVLFYLDASNTLQYKTNTLTYPSGQINIPARTGTRTTKITANITQNKYSEQRVCYKEGDTYKDEEGNIITFDKGYKPIFVSENQYNYWVYTTEYKYTFDQKGGTETISGITYENAGDITAHYLVKLLNPLYEVEQTEWTFDLTQNIPYTTIPEHTLTFTSNFGYIVSDSLYSPDVTVKVYDDTFKVTTFNRTFTHNTTHTVPASVASRKYFSNFIVLDDYGTDEYVYGVRQNDAIFTNRDTTAYIGYNFKNKLLNHSDFLIEPQFLAFNANGSYNYAGECYSIGYGYYRYASVSKRDDWNYFAQAGQTSTEVYDSLADMAFTNQGVRRGTKWSTIKRANGADVPCYDFMVAEGSRKQKLETFSPLINNGFISGFSYNGILVCPWETVDDSVPWYADDNCCFYKDADTKKWVFVEKVLGTGFSMVEDRYLVLNTTSYWNCWDTLLNRKEHYASDWNNRVLHTNDSYLNNKDWVFATAHNTYPANSGSGITSAYWPPIVEEGGTSVKVFIALPEDSESIELYEAYGLSKANVESGTTLTGAMIPKYYRTVTYGSLYEKDTIKTLDSNLVFNKEVANYPLTNVEVWQRNPSIFAKWTYSGNNIDYFTDGRYGYQLTYSKGTTMNTTPTLLSNLTGDVYNLTTVFVIQSMPYAVIDGKLYSLNYLDGKYQGMDCVLNIKGMQYVGAVPSIAFFYSPMNRCLYSFTGDCNLTKVKDAGAISKVYGVWYNSSTQIIYMATDDGLYMLGDNCSYRQEFFDVQSIYFLEDGSSVVVDYEDETYKAYHIYYDYAEGRVTNQVRLDTGLYGCGDNKVFTIDKWSIELFSKDHLNGEIKVRSFILNDKGNIETEDNTFKVTKKDWDSEFDNLLINYTPSKNKGVGVGLKLLSDFAINDITASATVNQETQPARVNI